MENDFLEYAKDLMSGKHSGVTADELAPDCSGELAPGIKYDPDKDTELDKITENIFRLMEANKPPAKALSMELYATSTDKPTYAGYKKSEWFNPKVGEEEFKRGLQWLKNKGVEFGSGVRIQDTGGTAYSDLKAQASHAKDKKTKPGPYDEELESEEYTPDKKYASFAKGLSAKYATADLKPSATEMFQEVNMKLKQLITRKTKPNLHLLIYGDPGVGKSFEVVAGIKQYIDGSGKTYMPAKGDTGKSMSALVPFFYKYSQNYVLLLDDNDKMIMDGTDNVNLLKGFLVAEAYKEPIAINVDQIGRFTKNLNALEDAEAARHDKASKSRKKKEGILIEVDTQALREENRFIVKMNGEIVSDEYLSLRESQELQNKIIPTKREKLVENENPYSRSLRDFRRISEAGPESLRSFLEDDDLIGEDEDEGIDPRRKMTPKASDEPLYMPDGQESEGFPDQFVFNSSVIFISNLDLKQVDSAILDRVQNVGIKLSLGQYLERLGNIYMKLAQEVDEDGNNINSAVRDWAKKCVYTVIGVCLEARKAKLPLWGSVIQINRKLTFRMFNDFVMAWEAYADNLCEGKFGRPLETMLRDEKLKTQLTDDLTELIIRRVAIPWMAASA